MKRLRAESDECNSCQKIATPSLDPAERSKPDEIVVHPSLNHESVARDIRNTVCVNLGKGVVLLKEFLSEQDQLEILKTAMEMGTTANGFFVCQNER